LQGGWREVATPFEEHSMVRLTDRRRGKKRSRQLWRHLRTAMRLMWRRPLVSVTVVPVLADGRVILVRRVADDRWTLPGGILDWGEDVLAAARRELEEESGLEIDAVERLLGVYSSPERDRRTHAVSITIVARASGRPDIGDPLEVSEIEAFPPDELPFGHFAHDIERQLRDYLDGRTVVA
jgi:ADP-ribose pyrophosphatase YjhB (NUDIX family)